MKWKEECICIIAEHRVLGDAFAKSNADDVLIELLSNGIPTTRHECLDSGFVSASCPANLEEF